ncbi:camphor resistance protein CrcB [Acidihalobacter yilgarnensis]|uniref:Fluoride-specific ion channel FluC n=1 Tax=Acidihalobacter yilgarnensis TaxID=2819280 RepID=A0A1D8IT26_9GAMM|nr:camphor resistance protein CrcB [Acidihalobacter yilgarnensis]
MQLLAIAFGGAVGAMMRFGVSNGVYHWLGRGFPWGTLAVNVLGSLAMGFLTAMLVERLNVGPEVRAAILTGGLGAFTTFSTFSIETLSLIEQGDVLKAGVNMLVSVLVCVSVCWLGLLLGRQL